MRGLDNWLPFPHSPCSTTCKGRTCQLHAPLRHLKQHRQVIVQPNMERPPPTFTQFEVLYSTQSFLTLQCLHGLPEQDVDFLEHNRCFHLPSRTVQEDFIYQYFLYLHPYYPLINERDFWDMYMSRDTEGREKPTMSLLVFQAMLFAASSVGTRPFYDVHPLTQSAVCFSGCSEECGIYQRQSSKEHLLSSSKGMFDPFNRETRHTNVLSTAVVRPRRRDRCLYQIPSGFTLDLSILRR